MQPTLLIMAAGMGSRYGSLKQLDTFGPGGETIIDYSLYDAIREGFGKVVFVIRQALLKDFEETYFQKLSGKIQVSYVLQELDRLPEGYMVPADRVKPWGTAHAVWVSASSIQEPFAVINGDDFYGRQSFRLMAEELRKMEVPGQYCMIAYPLNHTLSEHGFVSRGICEIDAQGYLKSVTERTQIAANDKGIFYKDAEGQLLPLSGNENVSMNLYGFTPDIFGHLETQLKDFLRKNANNLKAEFYLPEAVNFLVNTGTAKVKVCISPEKWFGVTYPEDKQTVRSRLRELIDTGVYPEKLWV
ncbi:nucleotidyltransferase [Rhodocytophaga rosea]|uniref:Nucleotidyltransferase n=1 Tax=Rhodocytophaga rosea TaxID=2704465 RepID=A0A6C0GHB8_9BACT|nr:sugar phosphate nucleotidyltransferase [Rhodocytophaga rosea]QHT67426.1 nucleotidyltransferase [Rhodocytophaga rosea]